MFCTERRRFMEAVLTGVSAGDRARPAASLTSRVKKLRSARDCMNEARGQRIEGRALSEYRALCSSIATIPRPSSSNSQIEVGMVVASYEIEQLLFCTLKR
jgi:hypothetical protein